MSRDRAVPADLPAGTVTFLFTDIEGSTRLLDELGAAAYSAALAEHRRIIRAAAAGNRGVEVDTQGDAFFFAFADARAALDAAQAAQRELAEGPIRVRMGLHTGTARVDGGAYVGRDVHLAARVAAAGHGGQVLLSGATRGLVDEAVADLGQHHVKDFAEPVAIFQLGGDRFPPLRTVSNTNLPRPASSFIGRERETAEVADALRGGARLVTLTGVGGTGKTRLAIEAAAGLVTGMRHGVFWVPLETVVDAALVMPEIAQVLGAKSSVEDHVGANEMLLLLDNLEQVIDAAPQLTRLLAACANLRLLVTSRERLRVHGEVEYAVPPLAEPEAVALFVARAGTAPDDLVAELCRRLDNLPLAVELAAARTSIMSTEQILGRLSKRLDLLKGGRDAGARQQTLRATIEWSHDLLSGEEKGLFERLAVFRGGCTLEAAEHIAGADIDILQSLVDKSLVRHAGTRFWMLETIREYALEQLDGASEGDDVRRRHAEFFLSLAQESEEELDSPDRDRLSDLLAADIDNLRASMDHFEAIGDVQSSMLLAGSLLEFWDERGHQAESLRRYESLLERDTKPSLARAKALDGAARMAGVSGNLDTARGWSQEALDIYQRFGNERGVALSQWGLAYIAIEQGDYARAEPLMSEAIQLIARVGNETQVAWALRTQAFLYLELGNRTRARELYELSLGHARKLEDHALEAVLLGALSAFAIEDGDLRVGAALGRESLDALASTREHLTILSRLGGVAGSLVALGDPAVAARILGYAQARHDELAAVEPWVERMNAETTAQIGETMDAKAMADEMAGGRAMTADQAIALATRAMDNAVERLSER